MTELAMPQVDFSKIGPGVGDRFPDIRLPDQHGQTVDLHGARGGRPARRDQCGVPYRGIFHLDATGVVVDRQFEQSYRVRPAPPLLVDRVGGARPAGPAVRVGREGVAITAELDSATFRPYEKHEVRVALQMADGVHVYGSPAPEGLTPLQITLVPFEGLDVGPRS